MMTKSHVSLAAALAVCAFSGVAHAGNDGTIEFTGKISSTTCLVEGSAPGGGAADKAVDLGTVSVANLAAAGERSGAKVFEIVIGGAGDTGCTDGSTARIRFDPSSPSIDATTGRLNIDTAPGTATNVQIEMASGDSTPINLYNGESQTVTIASKQAVIPFIGRYYATGKATAGDANARVAFQVIYD